MNGITHKQAQSFIHAELDGLLTDAQRRDLDLHLHECEACRVESESFSLLTARLRSNFRARWDTQDGPSKNVMANIQSQTRRIIMSNRIRFGLRTFAGIAALIMLAFVINFAFSQLRNTSIAVSGTEATNVALPVKQSPLIAFTSDQNGNSEIYTVHSDGTSLTNLTNNPAKDTSPVWSPDGSKIAFTSNRDGNDNIYVMDFDGGNLTRLTDDPTSDTNPVWSPDGTKIAYASGDFNNNNTNIYVMDSNGQNRRRLTNYVPNTIVWPSLWSHDSQFVFFEVYRQIVKVNINDGEIKPITSQTDENAPSDFILSKDGSTLMYLSTCNQKEAGFNTFCTLVKSIKANGENDETRATLKTPEICPLKQTATWAGEFVKWSPDHTKILFAFTCVENGWLYITNADGSDFKPLTNYPILGNGPDNEVALFDWSPDSQSVVFMSAIDQSGKENLYLLNINDALNNPATRPTRITNSPSLETYPAWQPMPDYNIVEEKPTPEPTQTSSYDGLVAFASDQDGNPDIYTMHADGNGLVNLTNNPGHDINPFWSPDGTRIAFQSDRTGLMQVFVMNADGSNVIQLTNNEVNHELMSEHGPWSPDGTKLLLTEWGAPDAEKWNLFTIGVDGKDKTLLAEVPPLYTSPSWSPDGAHIAFISDLRLYVVDSNGNNLTEITKSLPTGEAMDSYNPPNYYWSSDSQSIIFIASNMDSVSVRTQGGEPNINLFQWNAYEASLDSRTLVLNATTRSPIGGWWRGDYFVTPFVGVRPWRWVGSYGVRMVDPFKNCTDLSGGGSRYNASPSGNVAIGAMCPNGDWWLFMVSPQGIMSPLMASPIPTTQGSMNRLSWSPDDEFIAFNITSNGNIEMYLVNVTEVLKDPSIKPMHVLIGSGTENNLPVWQPQP